MNCKQNSLLQRMERVLFIGFLATLFAALLAISMTATAAPAEAAGCASRAEYRSLPTNYTKTPAWVQAHFGVRGTVVKQVGVTISPGNIRWDTTIRYPACASGHRVYVRFRGSKGHPAVAWYKRYA